MLHGQVSLQGASRTLLHRLGTMGGLRSLAFHKGRGCRVSEPIWNDTTRDDHYQDETARPFFRLAKTDDIYFRSLASQAEVC